MDELILKLKERFPLSRKLVVKKIEMKDFGSTSLSESERTITICIKKGAANQCEILAHEYAHALEFDRVGNHSRLWGKLYSEVYSAAIEEEA